MRVFAEEGYKRVPPKKLYQILESDNLDLESDNSEWERVRSKLVDHRGELHYSDLYSAIRDAGLGEKYGEEVERVIERRSNRRTLATLVFSIALLGHAEFGIQHGKTGDSLLETALAYTVAIATLDGNKERERMKERINYLLGR